MNIQQMIIQLENDFDSIKTLMDHFDGKTTHGRLHHLLLALNIRKTKCMEICGYSDMIFKSDDIELTYDKSLNPISYTHLNYYEEVMLCKHVYKYIHENYDHGIKTKLDVLMFKLL